VTWFALVAPPKVPQPIVNKLNADINEALRDPEVQKRLANLSAEVAGGSIAETAAFFKSEIETWYSVIKTANVKLEP
jgi:tripartite-type tricarboxylate transporter receptor subunit TctC